MVEPARRPAGLLRPIGAAALLLAAAAAAAQPPAAQTSNPNVLRNARDTLMAADDFSAALEPAERVAELSGAEQSPAAISDLMRLARVQAELDMFEEAELNYLDAIDRLRATQGEFAESLVPAYRALGRAYISKRDFAAAISVLEQAQHVSQRGAGLFNVEQAGVIDDMTLAYLGLGDTAEARRLQLERLENAERQYGADDPRTVPFRNHLADYHDRSRLRLAARDLYEQSLAVLTEAHGELDPQLLPTLRALLAIDLALGEVGEDVPAHITAILEADGTVAPEERSESLAALGDAALVRGADEAAAYYARAYAALAQHDADRAAAAFGEPRMLDFVAPLSAVDRAPSNRPYAWGRIELAFDVSAAGRAVSVRAVSVEPAARIGAEFVRRVRETHFRPRLVDGVPAETRGVAFAHDFRYYVEREPD